MALQFCTHQHPVPLPLQMAVEREYIPVVATIATDESGQALNINADTAAGEVCGDVCVYARARALGGGGADAIVVLIFQCTRQMMLACTG